MERETTEDRFSAKAQLDAFLKDLGAKLPAHRKSADPPEEYLKELFTQGRDLLSLLWVPLDELHTSPLANQILSDAGADETTHSDWALRLAVPALSWAELQAVKEQHGQVNRITRESVRSPHHDGVGGRIGRNRSARPTHGEESPKEQAEGGDGDRGAGEYRKTSGEKRQRDQPA